MYSLKTAKYGPKDVVLTEVFSNKEFCLKFSHGLRLVEDCIGLSNVETQFLSTSKLELSR